MHKLSKSIHSMAFLVILFIFIAVRLSNALNCYTCSYLANYSDKSCLDNITATRTINCTKKYCITMRQEAIQNASKVISFLRDCQNKPLNMNSVQTDATFRTYYRACQTDLCNSSNGKSMTSSKGTASTSASNTQGNNVHNQGPVAQNGIIRGKSGVNSLLKNNISLINISILCIILHFMAKRIAGN